MKPARPKRTAPRKPAPGTTSTDTRRARLEKELRASIDQIDEKGLLFLLRQAQVLIHNARVQSMQGAAPEGGEEEQISGPIPVAQGRPDTVIIERGEGGKGIFLSLGGVRKIMSAEEMKRLVRICYAAPTRSEAVQQLFTVLVRERKDILTDAKIGSPDNPLIIGLFHAVRETYRLEDR